MTDARPNTNSKPWYRYTWPWILMGLPLTVVVASIVTYVIAAKGADRVLSDNYYKEGLAINVDLSRDKRAHELGLRGEVNIDGVAVRLQMQAASAQTLQDLAGAPVGFELHNVSFGGEPIKVALVPRGAGLWTGQLPAPTTQATWTIRLSGGDWRMSLRAENTTPKNLVFIAR